MIYFSEREQGELPRTLEVIDKGAWGGIQALIKSRVEDGSFGKTYPETCTDGGSRVIGTDEISLGQAVCAEIPAFTAPPWRSTFQELPDTLKILDLVEFSWRKLGKPREGSYHDYFDHYHLRFDVVAGREEFREEVNTIFRRKGLAYELEENGYAKRLAPPILREALVVTEFCTGDEELDAMLEKARKKFFDRNIIVRRESLEALWDSWERLKTLNGSDKKTDFPPMLDKTAGISSPIFRKALEDEAHELTSLGNKFQIRHAETDRETVSQSSHIDYLFHRLFALILAILKAQ